MYLRLDISPMDLKGKPVVVLSSNDGCIVALTPEAKAVGLHRGDPIFKVKDIVTYNNLFKTHDLPPNKYLPIHGYFSADIAMDKARNIFTRIHNGNVYYRLEFYLLRLIRSASVIGLITLQGTLDITS